MSSIEQNARRLSHMISLDQLRQLNSAYVSVDQSLVDSTLQLMGNPTDSDIIEAARAGMEHNDRNVRVLMLRLLARFQGDAVTLAILAGLHDPERRVRDVAIQSSKDFVHYAEIAYRLRIMAINAAEKRKIRERALSTLLGLGAPIRSGPLPETVVKEIEPLMSHPEYQTRILHGLVQIDMCERVASLLQGFVANGTSEEAAMAQKALNGYRMVNIGQFAVGPERSFVLENCERACGRVFYWLPR